MISVEKCKSYSAFYPEKTCFITFTGQSSRPLQYGGDVATILSSECSLYVYVSVVPSVPWVTVVSLFDNGLVGCDRRALGDIRSSDPAEESRQPASVRAL